MYAKSIYYHIPSTTGKGIQGEGADRIKKRCSDLAPFLKEEMEGDFSSCHSETLTTATHGNCDCSESFFLYRQ